MYRPIQRRVKFSAGVNLGYNYVVKVMNERFEKAFAVAPQSSPEEFSAPPGQEKERLIEFLADCRTEVEAARACFVASDWESFRAINQALEQILKKYRSWLRPEGDSFASLPDEVLAQVIGGEYISERESQLRALPEGAGIYLPLDESGGGDFWRRREPAPPRRGEAGGLGQIDLVDVVGHGRDVLLPKLLVDRFIALYQETDADDLFAQLDDFLENCPIHSKQIDYLEARLVSTDGGRIVLEVETAGGVNLFVRDRATGVVTMLVPPAVAKKSVSTADFVFCEADGYPPLGWGFVAGKERKITRLELPETADIFLASDGLFNLPRPAGRIFGEEMPEFCSTRRGLPPEDFRAELIQLAAAAKENRKRDDVTLLIWST